MWSNIHVMTSPPQSLSKRELLQELLPLVATNLQLQRIYTEYQEQLDTVKLWPLTLQAPAVYDLWPHRLQLSMTSDLTGSSCLWPPTSNSMHCFRFVWFDDGGIIDMSDLKVWCLTPQGCLEKALWLEQDIILERRMGVDWTGYHFGKWPYLWNAAGCHIEIVMVGVWL